MTAVEQILVAAKHGSVEMVGELLAADPALVNAKGEYDKTPLHWAAEKNHLQLAEVLVRASADINAETTWGSTPLQWAANMGSREVAELLLEHGARPQLNMWAAAGLGMLDVVQSFWDSSSSRTLKPNAGQTRTRRTPDGGWGRMPPPESYAELVSEAFYIAARNGRLDVAKFLLAKGADINCKGFFGAPGLHWAAVNGHKEMVEFLIDNGADLHRRDEEFNSTPLGWALEGNQTEIAALLEQRGVGR
ncbi:MAG TPA: ankyrin repeat domain-containing protein [Candidatus Angelobacter sp.]